jgi:hypothetical protein
VVALLLVVGIAAGLTIRGVVMHIILSIAQHMTSSSIRTHK